MSVVLILRHGESKSMIEGDTDLLLHDEVNGLSEKGRVEAETRAKYFSTCGLKFEIHCSPVLRTLETGEAISRSLKTPLILDERLKEHSFANEKITVEEARTLQMSAHANPYDRLYGDESKAEHGERVRNWLEDFKSHLQLTTNYLIVTHGGTIDHLMAVIFGSSLDDMRHYHVSCRPLHFHQWDVREESDHTIWRLDGVNRTTIEIY